MSTKLLMTASSIALGVAGIILSFFPQEMLTLLGEQSTSILTIILQLLGALYFGFAVVNWIAKENLIGGIYGRPIVVGNVAHFVVGALALLKAVSLHQSVIVWIVFIMYSVFALLFSLVMYKNPTRKDH